MSDLTPPPIVTHQTSPMDVAEILLSGFHFDSNFIKEKKELSGSSSSTDDGEPKVCTNCGTRDTPLWRKGPGDKRLCNRCGVYWKRHNQMREIEAKPTQRQNSPKVKTKNLPTKTALKKLAVIVKDNAHSPRSPLGHAAVDFTEV